MIESAARPGVKGSSERNHFKLDRALARVRLHGQAELAPRVIINSLRRRIVSMSRYLKRKWISPRTLLILSAVVSVATAGALTAHRGKAPGPVMHVTLSAGTTIADGSTETGSPTPATVTGPSMAFTSATTGFVIPEAETTGGWTAPSRLYGAQVTGGDVLMTVDGGQTWATVSVPGSSFVGITFADANDGWVLGTDSLAATTDGGISWTTRSEPSSPLTVVEFSSPTIGIGVTQSNETVTTADGGVSWTVVGTAPAGADTFCAASGELWAAGAGGIYQSFSNGAGWTQSFETDAAWNVQSADIECGGGGMWVEFDLPPGLSYRPVVVEHSANEGSSWTPVAPANATTPVLTFGAEPGPFTVINGETAAFTAYCDICNAPTGGSLGTIYTAGTTNGGASATIATVNYGGIQPVALSAVGNDMAYMLVTAVATQTSTSEDVLETSNSGASWHVVSRAQLTSV
jgi:hypothetical protein